MNIGTLFGIKVSSYAKARKEFPDDIFSYLVERAGDRKNVLDVGCGTGIASRQMFDAGFQVTGSDIDEKMLEQATSSSKEVSYMKAPADKLPFADSSFDIITAFSAFHWFCNEKSVAEIKRVLSPNGLFFIVNKSDKGLFRDLVIQTVKQYYEGDVVRSKHDYDPEIILANNGFKNIEKKVIEYVETYSIDEVIHLAQSTSYWQLITLNDQDDASSLIRKRFLSVVKDGIFERQIEMVVVSGYRS